MLITRIAQNQRALLLDVAVSTGLFRPEEAEALLGAVVDGFVSGGLPEGHEAVCARATQDSPPQGWSYFAADPHAEGVWNLWWIGVSPRYHGTGAGPALLDYFERRVETQGGRVLVIETSDSDTLARARRFYGNRGYAECGRVPHFYATGESKVIFAKALPSRG